MKKGQLSQEVLIGVIIVLTITILSLFVVNKQLKSAQKHQELKECAQQVEAHKQMLKLTNGERGTEINCPTIYETLPAENADEMQFQIAERMRYTWDAWDEGKGDLFVEEAAYCQPQYVLDFENNDLKVDNFAQFLIETPIPEKNYSYLQYFSGKTNDPEWSAEKLRDSELGNQVTSVNSSKRKVVLFYYLKDSNKIKEFMSTLTGTGGGALIGGVVGGAVFGTAGGAICGTLTLGTLAVPCAAAGAAAGKIIGSFVGGFVGSQTKTKYPQHLSFILVRDYNAEELKEIGCEIAPSTQNT